MRDHLCLIVRPAPGGSQTATRVAAMGWEPYQLPHAVISYRPVEIDHNNWQAVLITSGHALRALSATGIAKHIPLLAVGEATAALALELGWTDVASAQGDGQALVGLVAHQLDASAGPLLYPRGQVVAGDIQTALEAEGFQIAAPIIYHSEPAPDFAPQLVKALRDGSGCLLLHAPSAGQAVAQALSGMEDEAMLGQWRVVCLSEAIATRVAHLGWRQIFVAKAPHEAALLEALGSINQA